jgi:hypothetical protein
MKSRRPVNSNVRRLHLMALCDFISETAALVARQREPLSAREAIWRSVLQGMPHSRNVSRLDLWESAYHEVAPTSGPSQTEHLFDELFEFGRTIFTRASRRREHSGATNICVRNLLLLARAYQDHQIFPVGNPLQWARR